MNIKDKDLLQPTDVIKITSSVVDNVDLTQLGFMDVNISSKHGDNVNNYSTTFKVVGDVNVDK